MAVFFVRLLIFVIPAIFLTYQVILPLLRNDPIFPMFNKNSQPVKDAEDSLIEAQAAKRAAELELEAARLHKEASAISQQTYKTETNTHDT
jgi:hypothetical protein